MLPPRTGGAPDAAVVLLHGYGSDGNDLISLAPLWQDLLPGAVFLAPNAPHPAQMTAGGFQWFSIDFEGDRLASRQSGVTLARPILVEFLEDLWAQSGLTPERTILAGFSQGAMMALHTGLSLPADKTLMGVLGFSGAFLPPEGFGETKLARPPVCLVHGDLDTVVSPQMSAEANVTLTEAGYSVSYHVSRGTGHGISPDGLQFASDFVARQLTK
nr:phospholipase [Devosia oryzisoli]